MGILSEDINQTIRPKCNWFVEFYGEVLFFLRESKDKSSKPKFWKNKIKTDLDKISIDDFSEEVLKNILRQAIHPKYFEKFTLRFSNDDWFFERKFSEYGPLSGIFVSPRGIEFEY